MLLPAQRATPGNKVQVRALPARLKTIRQSDNDDALLPFLSLLLAVRASANTSARVVFALVQFIPRVTLQCHYLPVPVPIPLPIHT